MSVERSDSHIDRSGLFLLLVFLFECQLRSQNGFQAGLTNPNTELAIRHYLGPLFPSLSFFVAPIYNSNNNELAPSFEAWEAQTEVVVGIHWGHFPGIQLVNSMT